VAVGSWALVRVVRGNNARVFHRELHFPPASKLAGGKVAPSVPGEGHQMPRSLLQGASLRKLERKRVEVH